jgi:hypothetical protein
MIGMNTSIVSWRWVLLMALVSRRDQLLDIAVLFPEFILAFLSNVRRRNDIGHSEH